MKKLIVFISMLVLYTNVVFSSNSINKLVKQSNFEEFFPKKTYSLSNDSVKARLNVIVYSKAIIEYDIIIHTAYGKVEQKGYALNLNSEIDGGVELETDDTGQTIKVNPFHSYYCGYANQEDIEIRISTDKKKVSIYSSRKLRSELFDEKETEVEKLHESIQMCGYLYLID